MKVFKKWYWQGRLRRARARWPLTTKRAANMATSAALSAQAARHQVQLEEQGKALKEICERTVGVSLDFPSEGEVRVVVTIDKLMFQFAGGVDRQMEVLAHYAARRVEHEIRTGRVWDMPAPRRESFRVTPP